MKVPLFNCIWLAAASLVTHGHAALAARVPPELQRWLGPQVWVRDSAEPAVALGRPGEFDDTHIFAPCVPRDADQFRLCYCGSRGKVDQRVFELGLALGRDGRPFEKFGDNPVLRFGDGKHSILTPTIVKTDGMYRTWFTRVGQSPWVICHAVSADGVAWKVTPAPVLEFDQPWELDRLFYPTVVHQDGVFLMWYGSYWRDARPALKTARGFAVSHDGQAISHRLRRAVIHAATELRIATKR